MKIEVHNRCSDFNTYRAARVKSLFNAESGCNFDLEVDIDIESFPWKIGVIVGPSGSGKTSLGKKIFGEGRLWSPEWPHGMTIVDAIAPKADFNDVTGALAAVGLGTVPSWLRPYEVLSNGEQFRANLARVICEAPQEVVVDEFTSVVDRQIAKFGALAFSKAWKRTEGKCVLLSCHHDVLEWIEPDWIFDTAKCHFARGSLHRPKFQLQIWQTDSSYWPLFKQHYYLKLNKPVCAQYFVGTVDGELVCHMAMSTMSRGRFDFEGRGTRLVVMPEWQGAGVGLRFLNAICEMWLSGENKWKKKMTSMFHTSHPGLCAALRRDIRWAQISSMLYGTDKKKSANTMRGTARAGYGGHFRAVQGFRYVGAPRAK